MNLSTGGSINRRELILCCCFFAIGGMENAPFSILLCSCSVFIFAVIASGLVHDLIVRRSITPCVVVHFFGVEVSREYFWRFSVGLGNLMSYLICWREGKEL